MAELDALFKLIETSTNEKVKLAGEIDEVDDRLQAVERTLITKLDTEKHTTQCREDAKALNDVERRMVSTITGVEKEITSVINGVDKRVTVTQSGIGIVVFFAIIALGVIGFFAKYFSDKIFDLFKVIYTHIGSTPLP